MCQILHSLYRIFFFGSIDGMSSAELFRQFQLVIEDIDRYHRIRAAYRGGLNGIKTDTSCTHDKSTVECLDISPVDNRAIAGQDTTGYQGGFVHRHIFWDNHTLPFGYDRVFGKSAHRTGHRRKQFSFFIPVMRWHHRLVITQVWQAHCTVITYSASGRRRRENDRIAGFDQGNSLTNLINVT